MKLGTKINLVLFAVIVVVLATGFWLIEGIEAKNIQSQVMVSANSVTDLVRQNIERISDQVSQQKVSLQKTLDNLIARNPSIYSINVVDVNGVTIVSSTSTPQSLNLDTNAVRETVKNNTAISSSTNKGAYGELEYYEPVVNENNVVIGVVYFNVNTLSNRLQDIAAAKQLILVVSAGVMQEVSGAITVIQEGLQDEQKNIDDASRVGSTASDVKSKVFYGLAVFDKNLNVVVSTGSNLVFSNEDTQYVQARKDIISGVKASMSYERVYKGIPVVVLVEPITSYDSVTDETIVTGVIEAYVMKSAYENRISEFQVRLFGIGIVFTAILIIVLAIILERQVVGPIRRFSDIAKKIEGGDLNQKVEHFANDEIGQFGNVFNSMVANFRELDRLKSDFISVAAHQLRTPLSGVKWALKLVLEGDLGELNSEQKTMISRGYETNEKMIRLVNDLLSVSRIENAGTGYNFRRNNFMELLRTLIDGSTLTSKQHNIELQLVNKVGEIPNFLFDQEKLQIALQNIIDNALNYTLAGGKVVVTVDTQGDYLSIAVSDTGVGIPAAELSKLFSKFFRASNVIHLQTDGSGLGLFIVKSIIERHGGRIKIDSVEGKGTTVTVTVPTVAELVPRGEDEVV